MIILDCNNEYHNEIIYELICSDYDDSEMVFDYKTFESENKLLIRTTPFIEKQIERTFNI